jgi:hypothetical protein
VHGRRARAAAGGERDHLPDCQRAHGRLEERDRLEAVELYFCECADPTCTQKVRLGGPDYERVRSDPTHFFVVRGHEVADVETVLESHPDWVLVEKAESEARDVAEERDPRQD